MSHKHNDTCLWSVNDHAKNKFNYDINNGLRLLCDSFPTGLFHSMESGTFFMAVCMV